MAKFKDNGKHNIGSRNGKKNEQIDRPLPQATASEKVVLGAILLNDDALRIVIDDLHPKYFYADAHQTIYKVMTDLFGRKQPVNLTTVSEELNKSDKLKEVGGTNYLTNLTKGAASSDNLDTHLELISQKFVQRGMIYMNEMIIEEAYKQNINGSELLNKVQQVYLSAAEQKPDRSNVSSLAAYVMDLIEQMEKALK